jgi:uncharacterized phage protein gp47/JayE
MTTYGASDAGFLRKPFAVILEERKARARSLLGAQLTLDDKDPYGAVVHSNAEELDQIWQLLEVAYYGFDARNAEDFLLFSLGDLTGLPRLPAKVGICDSVTVNLDANQSYAAGALVAHVTGDAANRWVNRDPIVSTTAGNYTGNVFVSEGTGSTYTAPTASLAVIAQRVSGWNSVTNTADAIDGKDAESPGAFRVRLMQSVAIAGSASTRGIRSDVAAVNGVLEVKVYENDTDFTVGVLPPHCVHVVVYDGLIPGANDNEIAQAIYSSKAGGIPAYGTTNSGTALDGNDDQVTVDFDRATITQLYCTVEVIAPAGTSEDLVKDAIKATVPTTIGTTLVFLKAKASPISVNGVDDVTIFKLDTHAAPDNEESNLVPGETEIYNLDSANISVTVVTS